MCSASSGPNSNRKKRLTDAVQSLLYRGQSIVVLGLTHALDDRSTAPVGACDRIIAAYSYGR